MKKQNVYIALWIFSMLLDFAFSFSMKHEAGIFLLAFSWAVKLGLGITGLVFYKKDKVVKKIAIRENQGVLVPFYLVMVLTAVFLFSMISAAFAYGGGEGFAYIVVLIPVVVVAIGALFFWELDFVRTVENLALRIIYGILTPVTWFVLTIIFVILVEIEE